MQQSYDLLQHQTQRLVMTQTLQQAIQLLQMSSLDLRLYLQEAIMENPMLDWPRAQKLNTVRNHRGTSRMQDAALMAVAKPRDLHSVLEEQLRMASLPQELHHLAMAIIGNLNDRGYLTVGLEEFCAQYGVSKDLAERALSVVQSLEPTGVGSRSLVECLSLQLHARRSGASAVDDWLFDLADQLIDVGLETLAAGQYAKLQAHFGCERRQLEQALALIQTLNPHPGIVHSNESTAYIIPDLAVVYTEKEYVVIMYEHAFPSLRFNEYYRKLTDSPLKEEEKDYLAKKTSAALSLLRSVEARRRTVFRVTEAIVSYQRDFFEFGSSHMKPLTMKVIADDLQLHESTISRALSGKYADTPQGVLELKSFFSTGLASAGGEQVSATSVRSILKKWIAKEDPECPLTDQELALHFDHQGIQVSRRTIAKYRDELHIPSSSVRKRRFFGGK